MLPVAVRCVYEIYDAVKIPILGMGGVMKVEDIIQLIMAGATLIGVGTATYYKGMKVIEELKSALLKYMEGNKVKDLKELVGVAHN